MNEKEDQEKSFSFVDKRRVISDDTEEQPSHSAEEPEAEEKQLEEKSEVLSNAEEEGTPAPPIDFSTFILSLSSSAAYHMGGFLDPVSGKTSVNLDLAKQTIDIIAMLKEKSKGNLTEDEEKLISYVLYDSQMKFVEASQGKLKPE